MYGFFVGQLVLVVTAWFLVKQFLLSSKSRKDGKYEPLRITRESAGMKKTESTSSGVEVLNHLLRELHSSVLLESILQKASLHLNSQTTLIHPFLYDLKLDAVQLAEPPILTYLGTIGKTLKVSVEWSSGPRAQVRGELGRYGVYLPFTANLRLLHLQAMACIELQRDSVQVQVEDVQLDLDSDVAVGHAVKLHDTQGHLRELLHSMVKKQTAQLIVKPFIIPLYIC